ncbi:hypothetical protein ACQ4LE_008240 [Meloidogyne hapla]|uniref:Uncharacterized protein n=1 Tax=Meloidogyne hapla TaxID=6305 RepID=A0A1I8BMS6_MELHA
MFISLLFILLLNYYGNSKGASSSVDSQSYLYDAAEANYNSFENNSKSYENKYKYLEDLEKHKENIKKNKYIPLYKDDIWSPTENDFKGSYINFSNKEEKFQVNEMVEIKREEEWILAKILEEINGKYKLRIESGIFSGFQLIQYPKDVYKIKEIKSFNEGEIVEIKNSDKLTGKDEWLKAKILRKDGYFYIIIVIERCRIYGQSFRRYHRNIRKLVEENFINENFEFGELVELYNKGEWIKGRITGNEKGKYVLKIEMGPLSGNIFRRVPNQVRKLNDNPKIDIKIGEIVEVTNKDEITGKLGWLKAMVLESNDGYNYKVMVINDSQHDKAIFERNPNEIRKIKSENFEIGEIVEAKNVDNITGNMEWLKSKVVGIEEEKYIIEVVEHCKLHGTIFPLTFHDLRKFKQEDFQIGEIVEEHVFDKNTKKAEWFEAKVFRKEGEMYFLMRGNYVHKQYPYHMRKHK